MSQPVPASQPLRVSGLSAHSPTPFAVTPSPEERAALAAMLELSALRKLRFAGQLRAVSGGGWELTGQLGATVVQPCTVTLAPVTTRIDQEVRRVYMPGYDPAEGLAPESEAEMPDDTDTEPLGAVIDPAAVMAEELSLALPAYPRAEGAGLGETAAAPEGAEPLTAESVKPFAGLAALRDKLQGDS